MVCTKDSICWFDYFKDPERDAYYLYDSWRTSLNKGPFRTTLIRYQADIIKMRQTLNTTTATLVDLNIGLASAGYEWDDFNVGGTLGDASATAEASIGTEQVGVEVGAEASLFKGTVSKTFEIFGTKFNLELEGKVLTAGYGGEISTKRIGFFGGVGWFGGGFALTWE